MKIFIDSANPNDIFPALDTGMVDGVTTNPSLVAKAGMNYRDAVNQILERVKGPVSLEVLSTEHEGMVREGRDLAKFGENVYVKVPMGVEGIKACNILRGENIKINMTLVFSPNQAMLAAKAGANFISPFVGRVEDAGFSGEELIKDIADILDLYGYESEILFASVRTVEHVKQAAIWGSDIATIPPQVFWKLFNHPMTDLGLEKFLKDFQESGVDALV